MAIRGIIDRFLSGLYGIWSSMKIPKKSSKLQRKHEPSIILRHLFNVIPQTQTLPQIQKYLTEDSIIVLTHTAVFLATGSIFNVLKTGR